MNPAARGCQAGSGTAPTRHGSLGSLGKKQSQRENGSKRHRAGPAGALGGDVKPSQSQPPQGSATAAALVPLVRRESRAKGQRHGKRSGRPGSLGSLSRKGKGTAASRAIRGGSLGSLGSLEKKHSQRERESKRRSAGRSGARGDDGRASQGQPQGSATAPALVPVVRRKDRAISGFNARGFHLESLPALASALKCRNTVLIDTPASLAISL